MKNVDMPAMPCSMPSNPIAVAQARACGIAIPDSVSHHGLTKREMIAMHIIGGLISGGHLKVSDAKQMPELAVLMADLLLTELERTCQK